MSNSTLAAPNSATGETGGTPAGSAPAGGGPGRTTPRRRRSKPVHLRNRPLWMLLPGGVLMILVIVVPLLVAVLMSSLDLDQYTLRSWLQAPFIGIQNYVEAVVSSSLLRSIGISVSFALIASAVTMPIGVLAALATQNKFRGRALVRSLFLIPYVLPAFVVGTLWRTMLQPGGVVDSVLGAVGVHPGLWLNGPLSYWSLIIAFLHNINAFTLPFILFGVPAPQDVDVLPVLTYVTSFQSFRFGLSAAMAICSLVLIAIPLFVYLRAVKLDSDDEGAKR